MASRKNSRSVLVAVLIGLALVVSSCSTSTDPETWEDALAEGKVEQNFLTSCEQADDGTTSNTAALAAYCQCSFDQLQETFSDSFDRFKDVESELRKDPLAINNAADIEDAQLRADMRLAAEVLSGCEERHL